MHLSEIGKYYYALGANGIEIKGHSYKNPRYCPIQIIELSTKLLTPVFQAPLALEKLTGDTLVKSEFSKSSMGTTELNEAFSI